MWFQTLYSVTALCIFYCGITGNNQESVASTGLDEYHSWTSKVEDWNKKAQNVHLVFFIWSISLNTKISDTKNVSYEY